MYSIFRSIEEPLRIHKIGDKKWRANRVKELLDMVEMPASVMGRYPNELSGGQRQRIAIARAMALDPDASCAMRPCPLWTCWCRTRCCACSTICRPKRPEATCSSPTTLAVVRRDRRRGCGDAARQARGACHHRRVFDHPQKQYTRDLLDASPAASSNSVWTDNLRFERIVLGSFHPWKEPNIRMRRFA